MPCPAKITIEGIEYECIRAHKKGFAQHVANTPSTATSATISD